MKNLFTFDAKNYTEDMPVLERFGVRGLICKDGLWAMQKSGDGEFKIPGGGKEKGETLQEALLREVREETGLFVIPESIEEFGEVLELREDIFKKGTKYVAHSLYYFCRVTDERTQLQLTESEIQRGYKLAWATLDEIIEANEKLSDDQMWRKRDTQVIKLLKDGGY